MVLRFERPPSVSQWKQVQALGFDVTRHLPLINAVAGRCGRDRLARLSDLAFVKRISWDGAVQKSDTFTVNSSFANVGWQQYSTVGAGIGVAVIDSGVCDTNPDFNSLAGLFGLVPIGHRIVADVDFTGLGASDQCGHGTHVAGIVAGDGSQSQGPLATHTYYGVAPGASILNLRVLDQQGQGTVSNVISAVQWCVANSAKYNIRVINLSMGHPVGESYTTDPLCQAVEAAWKSGLVVVCAAGNNGRLNPTATAGAPNSGYGTGYWSVESPGNDPYVITVGATKSMDGNRAHDQIASYSGRGPSVADFILKPDIIAPGNQVISCEDSNHSYLTKKYKSAVLIRTSAYEAVGNGWSKAYFRLSGTSMATPVVAGAVAQMLQLQPNLSPDTVKARLMISADKWADPFGNGDPCTYGAGYLNIPAALQCNSVSSGYAMSPALQADGYGNVFAVLAPSIYGQRALWGTGCTLEGVYGSSAMYGTAGNTLCSSRALWGTGGNWSEGGSGTTYSSSSLDLSSTSVLANGD